MCGGSCPRARPLFQELSDSESGSDCEDQMMQGTKFPNSDAFSSDDEAGTSLPPALGSRRGDCRVPAGGHCSINATRVQSFASSGCRKKEASTEGTRAAEWASCNFEGFEGSSISNYRSR